MFLATSLCLGFLTLPTAPPAEKAPVKEIDRVVRSFVDKNLFNGNVLVTKGGKTFFQRSYGMANMEWGIRNTSDTKFRIGSVTKQFTAMLIMLLKQEGKLALDGKITAYLPWYRKDTGERITVHHLLTHTAGIPNYTTMEAFVDIEYHPYTLQQVAEKYCSGDLEYEPGTKFKYNNSDYYLLSLIVEAIEKRPFAEVLQEKILDPLGMRSTGMDSLYPLLKKRATGYAFVDGAYQNVPSLNPADTVFGAGAMYSTVGDLARWRNALFTTKLLTEENLALMKRPYLGKYAYGLYVNRFTPPGTKAPVTAIGHNGGIRGFSTSVIHFVEDDLEIILTDNTTVHTRSNIEEITVGIYSVAKGR